MYFMNFFLGGEFSEYGSDVLALTQMDPANREDPMDKIFPKVRHAEEA